MTNITSDNPAGIRGAYALGAIEYAGAWLSSCARSLARLTLRPMRRTRGKVSAEYDAGRWNNVLTNAGWSGETDLEQFLIADRTGARTDELVARMDGVARRAPVRDYYEYRVGALARLLGELFVDRNEVVELGCGYGYNLLSLAVSWPNTHFSGFDISGNAVAAARRIAAHFSLSDRMQADVLDLTDGSHPNFARIRGKNVFTFFCIEQIPYDVGKVVDNILAQRPKRVVHAEPGTALLKWWRLRDWPNFLYLRSVDYQNELFVVLSRLEKEGKIRILKSARMPFSPSLQNNGLVVAWEPVSEQ